MLYIFHVDAGLMVTFDMSLTLQNVMSLKLAIEKKIKIPVDMIVLLVSGGEVLDPEKLVSSYGAGTDSSPIFLFTKPSMKDNLKQSSQYSVNFLSPIEELSTYSEWGSNAGPSGEVKNLAELKSEVEMCCSLPPAVSTVKTCARMAQQFSEYAQSLARSCEQLVHDQHLQHQGWTAVVANLEDIYNEFCERSKHFKEIFKKHKLKREYYHNQIEILNEVLEALGKIPMLPSLQLNAQAHRFSAFDVFEEGSSERLEASVRHSTSSDNKAYQDFGVDAFKMSEDEVFIDNKQKSEDRTAIPPTIVETCDPIHDIDEGITFRAPSEQSDNKDPTLLHWILAQGNNDALKDILDYCTKGIRLIDAEPLKEREAELRQILEYANVHGLKQIKGIEDRLYGLDQLRNEVKKLEKDQHDQAAALIQNRDRVVSTTCDPSVLPTLVQSHRCQLEKLLKNHETLVDIKRRIAKSKEELSHILKARLEAVLTIENSMSVQDAHQMLSYQCFNRLARYFEIVDQLHRAPAIFIHAVHEVARRRKFSDAYMKWALSITSNLLKIHDEEILRRQDFNTNFEGHFLRSLFPGMGDMPPNFGTHAPSVFDTRLPKLSDKDVEYVSSIFPDLSKDIIKYNMDPIVKYFQQQVSILNQRDIDVQTEDDKGIESETETGEFERLSRQSLTQIPSKIDISTNCVPDTVAMATLTEVRNINIISKSNSGEFENDDFYIEESLPSSLEWGRNRQENMDTHKISMEKLKAFLIKLHELCKLNIIFIKEELVKLQKQIDDQRQFFIQQCREISESCETNNTKIAIFHREETQRLTVDHELELNDIKKVISNKDEFIGTLKCEIDEIKAQNLKEKEHLEVEHEKTKLLLEKSKEKISEFEKQLEDIEKMKQKKIKELQDKMHLDYKAEIESMRSRFRLVSITNTDRSPSESSLEKIERTDVIEINSHNAIVMQTKENAEVEKEEAVKKAVEVCEQFWQSKMEEELRSLEAKFESEKQVTLRDAARRLIAEKDRQIELLRERELNLTRECTKYRETIQQLTDPETNDCDKLLKTQLASVENENELLKQQIEELKKDLESKNEQEKKDSDSEATVSSLSRTEAWRRRRSHTPAGLPAGTLSLSACLPGHTVLVMWDPAHDNYTLLQESTVMYFVHSDCLPALDLSIHVKNESERRLYAIGIVESKEFCYAKKSTNRYHMPRTYRFYRVRVRPARTPHPAPPCCVARHAHDGLRSGPLSMIMDPPVKKWLTYLHAPDIRSDTSQSSSNTEEISKISEVVTGTLINLDSPEMAESGISPGSSETYPGSSEICPGSSEICPVSSETTDLPTGEDQLDSIDNSDLLSSRMQQSDISCITDMECSVGRVPLNVGGTSRGPLDSELAEEAEP